MSKIPADLHYTKDHEWVRLDQDRVLVGITDHAQEALGEIVFVELPAVGELFDAGEEIATIESVKAASAVLNPLMGTVEEVNEELDGSPELLNADCYNNFLYALSNVMPQAVEALMSAKEYEQYLKTL